MQAFSHWFGALFGVPQSAAVEGDQVYSLFFLDNLATGRVIILSQTFQFGEVLDPQTLHDGLVKLIKHGDWRKLGGRLRTQPNGYLEVHVPREFTQDRPAIHFTTEAFDVAIEEHSLGKKLPEVTNDPSLQAGPDEFREFSGGSNAPTTLEDYVNSDRPILSLRVTTFTNSTLVSLIWPHAIAGALGLKEILSAWSKALKGESHIPRLLGAHKNVLDGVKIDDSNPKSYILEPQELKGWGFVKFALRMLWTVFWRPAVESRTVCLPAKFTSQLRENMLGELKATQSQAPQFLSEGDVLVAWASRFVARARGGARPIIIFNAVDVTARLDAPWEADGVYVQNLAVGMYTPVDLETAVTRPVSELAGALRLSIQQQATHEQISAQLPVLKGLGHKSVEPLYGDPDSQLVIFSNWTKFDLFNAVDFSPAISKTPSNISPGAQLGHPVYMHCLCLGENRFQRDCFGITGKDLEGNYWITACLYPEDWNSFGNYIQETWQRVNRI